jgi:hypothetical protein
MAHPSTEVPPTADSGATGTSRPRSAVDFSFIYSRASTELKVKGPRDGTVGSDWCDSLDHFAQV